MSILLFQSHRPDYTAIAPDKKHSEDAYFKCFKRQAIYSRAIRRITSLRFWWLSARARKLLDYAHEWEDSFSRSMSGWMTATVRHMENENLRGRK